MAEEPMNQPINDDQELAKVLAGVTAEANETPEPIVTTPAPALTPDPVTTTDDSNDDETAVDTPVLPEPSVAPVSSSVNSTDDLSSVKSDAINELRPLVDKLSVPAEEKFDTYLLLLRSTDDRSLIEPAHATAKLITDEARRAQALLDIIKEIDFLSQNQQ